MPEAVLSFVILGASVLLQKPQGHDLLAVAIMGAAGVAAGRWPLLSAIAVMVATVVVRWAGLEIGFAYMIHLVVAESVGTTGKRWLAAATVLASVLVWYSVDRAPAAAVQDAAVTAIALLGAAAVGYLRFRAKAQRDQARALVARAAATRQRIARDLHDGVVNDLTSIVRLADEVQQPDMNNGRRIEALATIADSGRDSVQDLRVVLAALRDPEEEEPDTGRSIRRRADRVSAGTTDSSLDHELTRSRKRLEDAGFTVDSARTAPVGATTLPQQVDRELAACLSELVNNVLRHGDVGSACLIRVDCPSEHIELIVINTITASVAGEIAHQPLGLVGVQERVETLDGTAHFGQRIGDVWAAQLRIPLPR